MENKNINNSLFYGNIVELKVNKELSGHLNDTLFFIDYIDSSKIKLISETSDMQVFYLNADGGIDQIDKIILIHQQPEGYCIINRLLPGKIIKISFSSEDAFIQGEITKLENDMITVKTPDNEFLYIDFEYSGLLEKYNIRSIDILNNYEKYHTDEYATIGDRVDDGDEVVEEGGGTMYSLEQQINDYIEKSKTTVKNKKQVVVEIEKYKMLLEEYTALEDGIRIKKIPNNQLLYSIFELNPKVVNLYSSYLHKDLYYNQEEVGNYEFDDINTAISKWQYSVIEKNYNESITKFSEDTYEPNITVVNSKIKEHHKKMKMETSQNVAIVNKVLDSKNTPFFFSIGKAGAIKVVQYDMVGVDKGAKIILNGLVFKSISSLQKEMNSLQTSNLLSKTLQNLDVKYEKVSKIRMLTNDILKQRTYFHENQLTFYEFKEGRSFKEHIEDLDFGLKELYEQIFDRKEVSMYQCLKKLCLFDISKLNTSEYSFIQKLVRENVSVLKRKINDKRSHFVRLNRSQGDYLHDPHEKMYEIIKSSYLSKVVGSRRNNVNYHMGELLKIANVDNMELLLFELRHLNRENQIDFNDDEVNEYIMDLQAKINGVVSKNGNENLVEYSKYYETKNEMRRDANKTILKNIDKSETQKAEKYDPIQFLYQTIISSNVQFNGTINEFVKDVDKLLRLIHDDNKEDVDYDGIFVNEPEREKLISTLLSNILEQQVRKADKCYVKEENKFYLYDGEKWISSDDSNTALSKKKLLQVKNSIDEFEDIKTRIINDYALKYIHQNEANDDKHDYSSEKSRNILEQKIKTRNSNKVKHLLKYNKQKNEYEKRFDDMNYDELMYYSPYTTILHMILGVDDLERKYSLIQRFITLFTIDNGNEMWFFCIKKNTKLIPKYLHRLSEAYLLYNNHDNVMNEICLREGYLSENGDSWIHKESGYTIKMMNFDTNYGYDENGFKAKMDTIEGISSVEKDDETNVNVDQNISLSSTKQVKINKNVLSFIKEMTKTIMSDLHIKLKNIDNDGLMYTKMSEIFQKSTLDPQYKKLNKSGGIYVILSMLLIYVQCKNINIEKPYSSCSLSFSGFPYEQDESLLGGVEYLSCYLYNRIDPEKSKERKKSNKQKIGHYPSIALKEMSSLGKSEKDIQEDLIYYIKHFLLTDDFVKAMISKKRSFEQKNPNTKHVSTPPLMFKPSLVDIKTKDNDEDFSHGAKSFRDKFEKIKREMELVNMKLEQHIKASIKNENPLLKTHYHEPFLVNFCCHDRDMSLHSLIKGGTNKAELIKLVKRSNDLFRKNLESSTYLKGTSLSIPVRNIDGETIDETRIYTEQTIYPFLLGILNLEDSRKKIPEHLMKLAQENNIDEIEDAFYDEINKAQNTRSKTEVLDKYGIEFSHAFMEKVVTQQHRHQYQQQSQLIDKSNNIARSESKVMSDFNFEFIENIGAENLLDKFEREREILHKKYSKFLTTHMNQPNQRKIKNKFKTILNDWKNGYYLEDKDNEQFELYIKQMYNVNYHLISLIPGLLNNTRFHNDVTFDHLNFAEAHKNDLEQHCKSYRKGFQRMMNPSESTVEIINNITKHKAVLFMKTFNRKRGEQYSFMLYLFHKILDQYTELEESTDIVISVNIEIIGMILEYLKNTSFSYESMITNNKQSKQSEKSIKTEMLRKMKPQEREAEKHKMAAKLGDWSYGDQSRVFKYYKKFYDEDTERANEIKNVAHELYAQTITSGNNDVYGGSPFEDSLTNIIRNEETQNISMVADEDGVVYDDDGSELDDYE